MFSHNINIITALSKHSWVGEASGSGVRPSPHLFSPSTISLFHCSTAFSSSSSSSFYFVLTQKCLAVPSLNADQTPRDSHSQNFWRNYTIERWSSAFWVHLRIHGGSGLEILFNHRSLSVGFWLLLNNKNGATKIPNTILTRARLDLW